MQIIIKSWKNNFFFIFNAENVIFFSLFTDDIRVEPVKMPRLYKLESQCADVFRMIGDDIVTAATFATDNILRSTKWMSMICLQNFFCIYTWVMWNTQNKKKYTLEVNRETEKRERDPQKIKRLKYISLCVCVCVSDVLMYILSYRRLLVLTRFLISFTI